ncbi:MAG: caspase family protein, partial [Planctomycetaceae bacterium]|nr:caspase family protein [Planctomycetaceae bacterium]
MLLTLCLFLATSTAVLRAAESGGLDPANTYGVMVGILEWADPATTTFSKADRQDRVLYQTLVRRGVPQNNLRLLLDAAATREAILTALREQAGAAAPDSTFVFYYAGHGAQTSRGAYFSNYDQTASEPDTTGLSLAEIGETLAAHFQGGRVLLLADCCHSGCLETVVERLANQNIPAACVTSVFPDGISTGNWTYTQTLIDVFRG